MRRRWFQITLVSLSFFITVQAALEQKYVMALVTGALCATFAFMGDDLNAPRERNDE